MKKKLAKFYIRYGRGEALLNIVVELVKVTVYFGAFRLIIQDWFGITISKRMGVIAVALYALSCIILGYLDECFGIWKLQNDYTAKELTPHFKEMDDKLNKLLKQ